MINKLKPKTEFSRNVLTLMTGTTIAQAIPIAISPILTRIYTPEDFGVFALYMSIVSIVAVVATGRYELAIMLPKKDEDALNIIALSMIIAFFVSFITFLIVFLFNAQITDLLGNTEISSWLYLIPVSVLLTGVYQSLNYWFNRKKKYKVLAKNQVIKSTATSTTNLLLGFGGAGSSGLILGGVLGQGIVTGLLSKFFLKNNTFLQKIKKIKLLALARKHKKLPIYNLPNAFIDQIRLSGINILIAKFFATATLGQFSLAWKTIQLPMSLIGGSISQVFFQKVSSSKKEDLYPMVKKFIVKVLMIAFPVFLFIYLFAEDIFVFVFGENWKLAGTSASVMTPWLFLNFVTSPLSTIFIKLNKQEILLIFSIFYMILPLGAIAIFYHLGFIELLKIITILMSTMLLIFIFLLLYLTQKEHKICMYL
jgi:O-antigen/teichoic acid export membrane protein